MPATTWNRPLRYLMLSALLGGLLWLAISFRAILNPLLVAALLAYLLNPAVGFVKTITRLNQKWASTLVYLLFLATLAAVLITLVPVAVNQANRLTAELQNIRLQLEKAVTVPVSVAGYPIPLHEVLDEFDELFSQLLRPTKVFRILQLATSNLIWVLVILVTAYYLLRDWDRLREWLIGLAPYSHQPDVRRLQQEIKVVWQSYLRGQLTLMLTVGILSAFVSIVVGLRGAVVLGLLAGALDIIPSLGPTAALIVAASLAWFNGSTHLNISEGWFAILVAALFSMIQLIENIWLQPRIMGRAMRLHPGLVFVAVVGALTLAGALMAVIIVPILGTAGVVGGYLHRRILGLAPWAEAAEPSSKTESPL